MNRPDSSSENAIPNRSSKYALWIVGLFALSLIVGLELYQPFYFSHDDNVTNNLPQRVFDYRSVFQQGAFPLINLHQYLGLPYYNGGTAPVFYPPSYLTTFLADKLWTIWAAMDVEVGLHLIGAAFAAFAYLRAIRMPSHLSIYGALLYLTFPYWLITSKSGDIMASTAFYIAALLACLETIFNSEKPRYLALQILLKTLFIYHSNIQFFFFYQLFEVLYIVVRLPQLDRKDRGNILFHYFFSSVVVLLLSLPLALPMKEVMDDSWSRSHPMRVGALLCNSVDPIVWFFCQLFKFQTNAVIFSSSAVYYLGGSIPFLVCLILHRARLGRLFNGSLLLFLITLIFSTQANAILTLIPPFNRFRWPYKWYSICVFAYMACAVILFEQLEKRHILPKAWIHFFFASSIICNLFVTILPESQIPFGPYHITHAIVQNQMEPLLDGRWQPYGILYADTYEQVIDANDFLLPTLHGEYAFAGYEPMLSRKTRDTVFKLNYTGIFNHGTITPEIRSRFNQWSVRYITTNDTPEHREELKSLGGMNFLRSAPSGLLVYENTQAKPFAWISNGQDIPVPIHFGVNDATIDTNGLSGSLSISLMRLSGWSYSFDGKEYLPLVTENKAGQMQIDVPPHVKTVTVRYFTPGLLWSIVISVLGLIVSIPLWIFCGNKMRGVWLKEKFNRLLAFGHEKEPVPIESSALYQSNLLIYTTTIFWALLIVLFITTPRDYAVVSSERPIHPINLFSIIE